MSAAPAAPASRSLRTSDGVQLRYLETSGHHARASARSVILVPGWSMPASIWREQLDVLGRRYRVIALDPRGQGVSEVPSSGFSIDRRADDLGELLAHVRRRGEKFVLVGWSLGALESLHYLHRHGDAQVDALVLVDSSVGENPPPGRSSFTDDLRRDRRATLKNFVKAIFAVPRPRAEIDALVEAAMRMPLEASLSIFPASLPRKHWRRLARGFAGPLLYAVTPQFAQQAANLQSNRPATRVEVFRDAGHALFADEPERFSAMITGFIDGLPARRSTVGNK